MGKYTDAKPVKIEELAERMLRIMNEYAELADE